MMVERTKVLDTIYVKYGLKVNYLQAAADHFGLQDDDDIKTVINSYRMKLQNQIKNV
jgi:hypothetical protein